MFLVPVFLSRKTSPFAPGTPLATSSSSGPPSETASGVSTFSPRGLPRRRPFFMQSASTRTLTGPSPTAPVLHRMGPRSFTLAELTRPCFSPTSWPRPTIDVRDALGRLVGSPRSADDWRLASLGISAGGIGCSFGAIEHAPAAYIASLSATAALSACIWPAFDEYDLDSSRLRSDAEFELQSLVPEGAAISDESLSSSQKALSSMIEARAFSEFMAKRSGRLPKESPTSSSIATLELVHGSHPFGTPPTLVSSGRLRVAIWDADSVRPLCGHTQDQCGDHALSCLCGGNRIGRHNAVRDVFHNIARDCCSLAPIREKPGLLPPRAPDDGDPTLLAETSAALPISGSHAAPRVSLRPGTSPSAAPSIWSKADWDPGTVFQHVESRKSLFHNTVARSCQHGAPLP